MPSYFITRGGPPAWTEQDSWALNVGGLVRKPMRLTRPMLKALPRTTYTVKHHCVEGWTAIATWTGVPVRAVAELVEPMPDARYLRFDSFDNGSTTAGTSRARRTRRPSSPTRSTTGR